jgi:hypothetical protein
MMCTQASSGAMWAMLFVRKAGSRAGFRPLPAIMIAAALQAQGSSQCCDLSEPWGISNAAGAALPGMFDNTSERIVAGAWQAARAGALQGHSIASHGLLLVGSPGKRSRASCDQT